MGSWWFLLGALLMFSALKIFQFSSKKVTRPDRKLKLYFGGILLILLGLIAVAKGWG